MHEHTDEKDVATVYTMPELAGKGPVQELDPVATRHEMHVEPSKFEDTYSSTVIGEKTWWPTLHLQASRRIKRRAVDSCMAW